MAEPKTVRVIVARTIGRGEAGQWHPIGYANFLEEAYAAVDQLFERERAALADGTSTGELEYDVWIVPDVWSVVEPSGS